MAVQVYRAGEKESDKDRKERQGRNQFKELKACRVGYRSTGSLEIAGNFFRRARWRVRNMGRFKEEFAGAIAVEEHGPRWEAASKEDLEVYPRLDEGTGLKRCTLT